MVNVCPYGAVSLACIGMLQNGGHHVVEDDVVLRLPHSSRADAFRLHRLHLFVLKKKNITARLTTRGEENRITSFAVVSSSSSSSLFFDIARFFFSMRAPEEKSEEKKRKKKQELHVNERISLSRALEFSSIDAESIDANEKKPSHQRQTRPRYSLHTFVASFGFKLPHRVLCFLLV